MGFFKKKFCLSVCPAVKLKANLCITNYRDFVFHKFPIVSEDHGSLQKKKFCLSVCPAVKLKANLCITNYRDFVFHKFPIVSEYHGFLQKKILSVCLSHGQIKREFVHYKLP